MIFCLRLNIDYFYPVGFRRGNIRCRKLVGGIVRFMLVYNYLIIMIKIEIKIEMEVWLWEY